MVTLKRPLIVFLLFFITPSLQAQKFGFQTILEESPERTTTFCVPRNEKNSNFLIEQGITVKYSTTDWIFISVTPKWIDEQLSAGHISDFYFENAPPSLLSDSARAHHFVNEVHAGLGGLSSSYTGSNIIIGYVDTGLDFLHEDFRDTNGNSRVLRYWDQTMPDNGLSPLPYGYGFVWDSISINNGSCTSVDNAAHGTTVSGQGSGDGSANGSNKGMAPNSRIIVVETDFTRPNWTLTVADACDYIFKVADTMGIPAVVNLSLGTYFGSHDGNDPASEIMESMIDAKPGRIIVSAAGNSGAYGAYHQHGSPSSDTNFVWFINNSSNEVFFDLWADSADASFEFSFGADAPGPPYDFRGRTIFHAATSSIGTAIYDTIWNGPNRIATVVFSTEYVGANYHMVLNAAIDSTTYLYRFETTGSGQYDLWSGDSHGFNDMVLTAPPLIDFPDSALYVVPDTLQTIVSSWNCSEKIVSVGNMRNRLGHIDNNNTQYYPVDMTSPGKLSPNSSKGPTRHNIIKPTVSAAGDVSLSSGPLWVLTNPAYNALIDSGGMHLRNGGTSMASPVVAGIAALYLEQCGRATYQNFIDDLSSTAYSDAFTGTTPNNAYGYGKAHALNTLLQVTFPPTPTITSNYNDTISSTSAVGYEWYLDGNLMIGEGDQDLAVTPPYGSYQVLVINSDGCSSLSAPFVVSLSLQENDNNSILVYPNPSNSILNIDSESTILNVNVTDFSGKKIELRKISTNSFDIEQLSEGVYMISISTEKGIYNSKIIRL